MGVPQYVRIVSTGRVIAMAPWIEKDLASGIAVPYTGPIPVPVDLEPVQVITPQEPKAQGIAISEPPAETATAKADRIFRIVRAVEASDRSSWSAARFGRPSMPLLADIEAAVGFKVTSEEVIEAVTMAEV